MNVKYESVFSDVHESVVKEMICCSFSVFFRLSFDCSNFFFRRLVKLRSRRLTEQAVFAFRFGNGGNSLPRHLVLGLAHWLSSKPAAASRLRNADDFRLPRPRKNILKSSPLYLSLSFWNSLPPGAKSSKSPRGLRSFLSSYL